MCVPHTAQNRNSTHLRAAWYLSHVADEHVVTNDFEYQVANDRSMSGPGHSRHSRYLVVSSLPREQTFGQCPRSSFPDSALSSWPGQARAAVHPLPRAMLRHGVVGVSRRAPSPEIWSETISGSEELLAGSGVACFWAISLEEIIGGVASIGARTR